jgi:uncharacterized protein YbbK (DUF523 family)
VKTNTDQIPAFPRPPIPVAVSECLIGNAVRYDGGHRRADLPHDELGELFTWHPICPEVGIGMGVPRQPIHLVGEPDSPRAVEVNAPSRDYTRQLQAYAVDSLPALSAVHGYIFKNKSPSCGLFDVEVQRDAARGLGRGIYAAEVTHARRDLPVEESGRLIDAVLRQNFVTRVFVHAHWHELRAQGMTAGKLRAFHHAYEDLVAKHNAASCNSLERLASDLSHAIEETAERYLLELLAVLSEPLS